MKSHTQTENMAATQHSTNCVLSVFRLVLLGVVITSIGCRQRFDEWVPAGSTRYVMVPAIHGVEALPVLSLHFSESISDKTPDRECASKTKAIVLVYSSGRTVFSEDRRRGGAPYSDCHVPSHALSQALERIEKTGLLDDVPHQQSRFGPGASRRVITVYCESKAVQMASWHELLENDVEMTEGGGITAGVSSTGRKDLEAARFTRKWDEVKNSIFELINLPGEMQPDITIELRRAELD